MYYHLHLAGYERSMYPCLAHFGRRMQAMDLTRRADPDHEKGKAVYQLLIECRGNGSDVAWGEVFQARLLEAGLHLDDYNMRNPFSASALHFACLASDKAACRYLINQGVDVNRGVYEIRCPIIRCQHSRSGVDGWDIRRLPHERDINLAKPMTIAATIGCLVIVEMLLDVKASRPAQCGPDVVAWRFGSLVAAVREGHTALLQPIMRSGVGMYSCVYSSLPMALQIGVPDRLIFEMVCRAGFPERDFSHVDSARRPVRFMAFARALGYKGEFHPAITKALKTRVTSIKLANMTGDLQRGFEGYHKAFMATKAITAQLMERVYDRLSTVDML